MKGIVGAVIAIALLVALLHSGHGSSSGGMTNSEIRAQVGQLTDAGDGTDLTLKDVPWCVAGVTDNEWECHVRETNHSTGQVWTVDMWAKCSDGSCRLEDR